VPSITSARPPLREDVGRRTHRYLVSMAIRTVCVVAAVLVDGPLRWVFLVGAVFLPYIAVVLANAGRERARGPEPYVPLRALEAGAPPAVAPPAPAGQDPDPDHGGVDGRAA
jgi:hypothetical protein